MEFNVEKIEDVAIVTIPVKTLEMKNIPEFKRDIGPVLEANGKVVFDMSQMEFIDSSGCGSISFCVRKIKEKGNGSDLKICGVSKQISATFRLIRLNKLVEIFESREEAIKAFAN